MVFKIVLFVTLRLFRPKMYIKMYFEHAPYTVIVHINSTAGVGLDSSDG